MYFMYGLLVWNIVCNIAGSGSPQRLQRRVERGAVLLRAQLREFAETSKAVTSQQLRELASAGVATTNLLSLDNQFDLLGSGSGGFGGALSPGERNELMTARAKQEQAARLKLEKMDSNIFDVADRMEARMEALSQLPSAVGSLNVEEVKERAKVQADEVKLVASVAASKLSSSMQGVLRKVRATGAGVKADLEAAHAEQVADAARRDDS